MKHFDVAIVGAGPAGSSAAITLARAGYSAVLLEKKTFPREKLCGDFLNPVNWPVLERLHVAAEILSQEHQKVSSFRMTSHAGSQATVALPAPGGNRSFGLGLRRSILDDILLRQAKIAGAEVGTDVAVRAIRRAGDRWSLNVSPPAC
jgi:menaquinone-9 beta-reductase